MNLEVLPISLEAGVVTIGVFMLLYEAFVKERDKSVVAWTGITGLALILVLSFFTTRHISEAPYAHLYKADVLAMFFKRFALVTTIIVLVMSLEYRGTIRKLILGGDSDAGLGEFYSLPVLTCAGLMWMVSAADFILIFVSLELVTISFYVLVSYMRRSSASLEAGVKYLILGALSTGFLVYGLTWIYGLTGYTNLDSIHGALAKMEGAQPALMFGVSLVLIGLCFKIAATPFQFWVPDVYQGAPTPITAFLSVGSKAAGFVVLMRVLPVFMAAPFVREKLGSILVVLAAATLLYGNLAALPQDNLKRLLAYSSIAHAGYLLVAIAAVGSPTSPLAVTFYLAGYLLMTLLSFMVMVVVSNQTNGDDIRHFNGLGKRSPFLAFALLVGMASLAGVPLTVGFVGKFLAFYVAWERQLWLLLGIGIIGVGAGFYYYLKVVRAMYWSEPVSIEPIRVSPFAKLTIGVLTVAILLFGVYFQPLFALMR